MSCRRSSKKKPFRESLQNSFGNTPLLRNNTLSLLPVCFECLRWYAGMMMKYLHLADRISKEGNHEITLMFISVKVISLTVKIRTHLIRCSPLLCMLLELPRKNQFTDMNALFYTTKSAMREFSFELNCVQQSKR